MDEQRTRRYVPSRFHSLAHEPDGSMILHSSRTGAIGVIPPEQVSEARSAMLPHTVTSVSGDSSATIEDLIDGGFLVPEGIDEDYLAHDRHLRRYTDKKWHLIVMPTEQCNFRCTYCYESFKRGKMEPAVERGLVNLIGSLADADELTLSWFGGEPLVARDVVLRVTKSTSQFCRAHDIELRCAATTNGYYLDYEYAREVIPAGLKHFQLTLDGVKDEHDKRRVGADGSPTFDVIWKNLLDLRASNLDFLLGIRHNIDPDNHKRIEEFLDMLGDAFGGDSRFEIELQPIGRWGGPNDDSLNVCEGRDAIDTLYSAKRHAVSRGFRDAVGPALVNPGGSVCYAADPHSFVVGPDGQLYKCTVELDYHERNKVGRLLEDGTLDLDWRRLALWTETDGLDVGQKCGSCYFKGSCFGAVCPKEWLDQGDVGCPPVKNGIKEELHLIRVQAGV